MKFSIVAISCLMVFTTTSIYSLQFQNVDGNTVQMSQYHGKKILLVNIATESTRVNQLGELQQLQQEHVDSLVIIGFPSNSFGHEGRNNADIKQFCQAQYGITFLLAEKNPIAGPEIQSIYNWLTNIGENGIAGDPVKGDFQKFLINESGELVGVFAPSISPLSQEIVSAIINQN